MIKKLFIFILFLTSLFLYSEGRQERNDYRDVLDKAFFEILEQMETDGLTAREGKGRLDSLRNQYGWDYTDQAGVMDALLDSVDEGRLTPDEARFQYGLLNESPLMDNRAEQWNADKDSGDSGRHGSSGGVSGESESSGEGSDSSDQGKPGNGKSNGSSGKYN